MAGHKRTGEAGDELLCGSDTKKAKRQITKGTFENGKRNTKKSTRRYRGCNVTLLPRETA